MDQVTISQRVVSDNGLVPNMGQDIIWTNESLVYWNIYTPSGFHDLIAFVLIFDG